MASVNENLLDQAIRHQIGLQRYSTATVRKIIALLNRTDADLVKQLQKFDPSQGDGTWSQKRLDKLLEAIRTVNKEAYGQVNKALSTELKAFSAYEGSYQVKAITSAMPVAIDSVTPSAEQLYAAVNARPFQGRLLKEWGRDLEAGAFARVRDTIRMGFVEGQTTDQIVRRLMGTRANQYSDGLLETNRRSTEMVVRTAISHTANVARQETYKANSDVVAKWRFVATLDQRTSLICITLDGQSFELGTGPQPPRHPNCRSTSVPVTKSWRELGFDVDDLPPATRASMDGQVPADLTYADWLKKQPHSVVEEVLGADRAALYRTGGLDIDRFVDDKGKVLTLDHLKKQDAAAFELAGLNNPVRPPRGAPQDEVARFLEDVPAQRELLERAMGDLDGHVAAVEAAIDDQGWDAPVEPLLGIRHYTGDSYIEWNKRSREGSSTSDDRKLTALTAKGIADLPAFQNEVWRAPARRAADGDAWWDRAEVGQTLALGDQLQSFSASRDVAAGWARDSRLLVRISNPTRGAYIERISQNPGEEEVLLPPGLRYKVVAKRTEGSVRIIDLEIVDDD